MKKNITLLLIIIRYFIFLSVIKAYSINENNIEKKDFFSRLSLTLKSIKNKIFNIAQSQSVEPAYAFKNYEEYKYITFNSILGFSNYKKEFIQLAEKLKKNRQTKQNFLFLIGSTEMHKDDFAFALANESELPIFYIDIIPTIKYIQQFFIEELPNILLFLQKNSPCIFYINNFDRLLRDWSSIPELTDLINFFIGNDKNITGIFGINSLNNYNGEFVFNKSINRKIYLFESINNNDLIDIINFYFKQYNLTLDHNNNMNNLISIFKNMTIDEIKNNIEELKYNLSEKNKNIITYNDIMIFAKTINNNTSNESKKVSTEFITDKTLDDIYGYKEIKKKIIKYSSEYAR